MASEKAKLADAFLNTGFGADARMSNLVKMFTERVKFKAYNEAHEDIALDALDVRVSEETDPLKRVVKVPGEVTLVMKDGTETKIPVSNKLPPRANKPDEYRPFDPTMSEGLLMLEAFGGVEGLCTALASSRTEGICAPDLKADIASRHRWYGPNKLPETPPDTFLELCWIAFQDFVLIGLFFCGIFSIVLGVAFGCHPEKEWVEGFAILLAVSVVVLVTAFMDWRKDKQFRKLQLQEETKVIVIRNGKTIPETNVEDLVVGDIVEIKQGDIVPADGIVISANDAEVDESALTGEPDAKKKISVADWEAKVAKGGARKELDPWLLGGTNMKKGTVRFLCCNVGLFSTEGVINSMVNEIGTDEKAALLQQDRELTQELDSRNLEIFRVAINQSEDAELEEKKAAAKKESILTAKLDQLAISIGKGGFIASALAWGVLFIRFMVNAYGECHNDSHQFTITGSVATDTFTTFGAACDLEDGWPSEYWAKLLHTVIVAITVLVVAIPEGLPLAVTIALAYSVEVMFTEMLLVRELASCETMGNAGHICSDKTGTLTLNKQTIVKVFLRMKEFVRPEVDEANPGLAQVWGEIAQDPDLVEEMVAHAAVNTAPDSAYGLRSKLGKPVMNGVDIEETAGNVMDAGFLKFADNLGSSKYDDKRSTFENVELKRIPYDSTRKMCWTAAPKAGGGWRVYCKGAPDKMINFCTKVVQEDGTVVPMTEHFKQKILAQNEAYAADGLRNLMVAYRDQTDAQREVWQDHEADESFDSMLSNDLTCTGLLGYRDPVRPEVPNAIAKCMSAGVTVHMVTGDQIATAKAIAKDAGIKNLDGTPLRAAQVMTGQEFWDRIEADQESKTYNKREFERFAKDILVMARCQPQHKEFFVRGLIDMQEIVAVTGDGTNDAPALKTADVGFAMGIAGTKVAQKAAAITVLDDNFATIVKAIEWGRNVYDSIGKFLVFQLTVNIVAVLLVLSCACIAGVTPLGALQLLWVNMIMDTLASLALATEAPRPSLMMRRPYDRDAPVVDKQMILNMLGHSFYQLVSLFVLCFDAHRWFDIKYGLEELEDECETTGLEHLTIIFNTFVWMQLFNEINSRRIAGERNVFEGIFNNFWFLGIMALQIIGQVLICEFGADAFGLDPDGLKWDRWLVCLGFGAGSLVWHQILICISPDVVPQLLVELFRIELEDDEDENDAPPRPKGSTMESITQIQRAASRAVSKNPDAVSVSGSISSSAGDKASWGLVRKFVLSSSRSDSDKKKYFNYRTTLREQLLAAAVAAQDGDERRERSGSVGQRAAGKAMAQIRAEQEAAIGKAAPAPLDPATVAALAQAPDAEPAQVVSKVVKSSVV